LITIDDILEAIVGDIAAAGTPSEEEAIQRADGSWLVDGMLTVDKFKELFNVRRLPGEGKGYYQTLGGFVMMSLGRVPSPGEYLEWGGLRLEVVDMDGRRIDKVLVVPGQRVSSGAEGA
ncbi:MAG: hypothetical protein IT330_03705, partial [Anaerolineae bacterium]|nr:hypothetical protein [Anaerolineae bacterium]